MASIQYLIRENMRPDEFAALAPLRPFAPAALGFIDALSGRLLRSGSLKRYPELMALGFWMRKANLAKLKETFLASAGKAMFQPRGTAFHIAPSNVDSIFIYSWFLSLMCGNKNIVRLSSRGSGQLEQLIDILYELLSDENWHAVGARTLLVRYEHDAEKTAEFSRLCDVRIVWGGNRTVSEIRQVPLPPYAYEIALASKFSMALIQAENWSKASKQTRQEWLERFFNDAYWFTQMACSSPRMIVWHGRKEDVKAAQERFWPAFSALTARHGTDLAPMHYVDKRVAEDLVAQSLPDVAIHKSSRNDISRIQLSRSGIRHIIDADLHCGGGLFYETSIETLDDLLPMLGRRIQTVIYAGYPNDAELREFVGTRVLAGIDRIVPFGRALEFSPIWDGFDLFRVFLRQVDVA